MKKNTAIEQVSENDKPPSSDVIKVRLMGTPSDIESYSMELETPSWKIRSQSDVLDIVNSTKYKRKYIEVEKNSDDKEEK